MHLKAFLWKTTLRISFEVVTKMFTWRNTGILKYQNDLGMKLIYFPHPLQKIETVILSVNQHGTMTSSSNIFTPSQQNCYLKVWCVQKCNIILSMKDWLLRHARIGTTRMCLIIVTCIDWYHWSVADYWRHAPIGTRNVNDFRNNGDRHLENHLSRLMHTSKGNR